MSRQSPKILQVCLSHHFGGMEKFCVNLSARLAESNPVRLLVLKDSPLEDYAEQKGLTHNSLRFLNYIDVRAMYKIRRWVQKYGIDIVHHHGSSEMGLLSPAVWDLDHVKLINHKNLHISHDKKDPYHRIIYSRADSILAVSDSVRENILKHYPVDRDIVHVFPNAINARDFTRGPRQPVLSSMVEQQYEEANFLTTISRLVPGKGLKKTIKVVSRLFKRVDNAILFVVGEGEESFVRELKELVPNSLNQRILFPGFQTDVASILKETDLFLSFSEGEALPFSVIEAMVMDVPILATDVTGNRYLLKDNPECLVNPESDLGTYTAKIRGLLNRYSGKKIYDTEKFTYDHLVPCLEKLYRSLLSP